MRNIVTENYEQISKVKALKLLERGADIYLQSSNMLPDGVWQQAYPISYEDVIKSYEYEYKNKTIKEIFESNIQDFKYYFNDIFNFEGTWFNDSYKISVTLG